MVRKPRRKTSVRRTRSAGSYTSSTNESSVPPSPVAKFNYSFKSSPGRSSFKSSPGRSSFKSSPARASFKSSPARSINSTIVAFEEERQFFRTSLDWSEAISASKADKEVIVQIKEANSDAENACDFICRAHRIICSSYFMRAFLAVVLILPIAMISIGVKYLNDCPVQPMIPVYLLVGGCFGLVKLGSCFWKTIQSKRDESIDNIYDAGQKGIFSSRTNRVMSIVLSVFLSVWHGLGTFWVGSIWRPRYKQLIHEPSNWCDSTVYIFAMCQILGLYAFMCLFCLTFCLLASIFRMCGCAVGSRTDV
ncbi:transmembrane protein 272 [Patella vulgata]|uniref:transmembrane protein 272 n=1 Tax=Patella vulgata TaxID=6465 RepID=UPI0021802085|nr:transmembrane protein 272 [Patella vulgata]